MARRGLMTLAAALLVAVSMPAAPALGDGDPASDVLLGENVFYPYSPPVEGSVAKALDAATAAAKRARFPLKVALIGAPVDLGVIPDLFGKPQKYAEFLDQEISFRTKQPLLVVMAAGYGVEGLGSKATAAVASLPKPSGTQPTDLAKAALPAVAKLAEASGHPLTGVPEARSSAGSSSISASTIIIVVCLAIAAVAVAAALVMMRRRERAGSAG